MSLRSLRQRMRERRYRCHGCSEPDLGWRARWRDFKCCQRCSGRENADGSEDEGGGGRRGDRRQNSRPRDIPGSRIRTPCCHVAEGGWRDFVEAEGRAAAPKATGRSKSARARSRPSRSRKNRTAQICFCVKGRLVPTILPAFQAGRDCIAGAYVECPMFHLLGHKLAAEKLALMSCILALAIVGRFRPTSGRSPIKARFLELAVRSARAMHVSS